MTLTPFIGFSVGNGFLYLGAGPSVAQTHTNLSSVIGFADINGVRTSITGAPTSFSSSDWAWGGAAAAGITYFIGESWFFDVNYTFTLLANPTNDFSAPFANSTGQFNTAGVLSGNYSGNITTHAIVFTINKAF